LPYFGQYRQALLDANSSLAKIHPHVLLFAIDANALVGGEFITDDEQATTHLSDKLSDLTDLWRLARDRFGAQVIQQTLLPTQPTLLGSAEYRAAGSPAQ